MAQAEAGAAVTAKNPLGPLARLLVERLLVGDQVAAAKSGTGSPVEDPVREKRLLDSVRKRADSYGLDPGATVAFFRDQIAASKVVQRGLLARWAAHPEQAPDTRPDLSAIRVRLDLLTTRLLHELSATRGMRSLPVSCQIALQLAARSVSFPSAASGRGGLDPLHRRALERALPSVCATHPSQGTVLPPASATAADRQKGQRDPRREGNLRGRFRSTT